MPLVTPPTTTTGPQPGGRDARSTHAPGALRLRLPWPRPRHTPWEQFCAALAEEKQLVERLLQ